MSLYLDSGVLIKLYVREANSGVVIAAVANEPSLLMNALHELEITNTFRALEGRGVVTASQRAASEHTFESDKVVGRLRVVSPNWTAAFRRAHQLSREHTAPTLARSLDVLHIAVALTTDATVFMTADRRQWRLAKRAQLETRLVE
jgi:predicted nucleic acid-binding protein